MFCPVVVCLVVSEKTVARGDFELPAGFEKSSAVLVSFCFF